MSAWYRKSIEQIFAELNTSAAGLSETEALSLQFQYGKNALETKDNVSALKIFLSQFSDVMIMILIGAAVISFITGDIIDGYVIIVIVIVNAIVGFVQQYRAEQTLRRLRQMAGYAATVVRDGNAREIDATELVPGDVVLVDAGDVIPADGRLFEVNSFKTEEAVLTGESYPVAKQTLLINEDSLLPADIRNMVFKGTIVSSGSAKMVVTATGMATEIGKIAALLNTKPQVTPLQKRLKQFSKQLVVAVLVICIMVFIFGLIRKEPVLSVFLTALSLAVAALPEALPAVVTIMLARGASAMARQNALIRQLPAVETLGSVTYICSDKTGTLTLNKMKVDKVWNTAENLQLLYHAFNLNNEVQQKSDGTFLGDSTEVALLNYARNVGARLQLSQKELPVIAAIPFDSERMRMGTLHEFEGKYILLVKGAPTKVADILVEEEEYKQHLLARNREWAAEGLRVLFFAFKVFEKKPDSVSEELEQGMHFLGMVGLIDPPREEVMEAIKECRTAGIKTVMITGDQPLTALAIAKKLNVVSPETENVLTGKDLAGMPDEELSRKVQEVSVYARVSPEQKLKIVRALQQRGEFVAMTGDGVNDAPSLKQANIGIAMGITGSDVSREAAHMVLMDDNFTTIVKAVKEGRRIYENLKKFMLYVLSCNLGEILVVLLSPFLGFSAPLLPIHILWINLVTDGLPGIALTADPAAENIMKRPPRKPGESIFAGGMAMRIVVTGALMAAGAFVLQYLAVKNNYSVQVQQTLVFTMLCLVQLGNSVIVRSHSKSVFNNPKRNYLLFLIIPFLVLLQLIIISVPFLQEIFKTTALTGNAVYYLAIIVAVTLAAIEGFKLLYTKYLNHR